MPRVTRRVIARRAVWTLAYTASVFLLVAALAYAEWTWEGKWWTGRLVAQNPEIRAQAMSDYGLRVSPLLHPVPCHSFVRGLSDVPEVRREALPAVVRLVRAGRCTDELVTLVGSQSDPSARIAAARALSFAPASNRVHVIRFLSKITTDSDSVGMAVLETLHVLRSRP